jgi:hypothetical protein
MSNPSGKLFAETLECIMMKIKRRELGILAASSLLLTALPFAAYADNDDITTPKDKGKDHHEVHVSGKKHHSGRVTADFLQYNWKFGFHSKSIAQNDWKYDFPENGQASILIDYKGNWQFTGSFPSQSLVRPCRVTVGVGLKSSLGKIMAFTKTLTVTNNGASWSKQGHDQIVEDLWKEVVKGHEWQWSAHTHQEQPQEPPAHDGGSNGGDSTFGEVTGDLVKGLLGPISWFL